ncbi:hypothetical protein IGI04_026066, partial [Brassica rapa subsp. trilocularis]
VPAKMSERRKKRRFDVGGSSAAPPPPPVRDQYPWPREREDEPIPLFDRFDDTRKAAKSAACRNLAIEDTWDDYDNIFYNEWLKVSIEPMRFSPSLDSLHYLWDLERASGRHHTLIPRDFDILGAHSYEFLQLRQDCSDKHLSPDSALLHEGPCQHSFHPDPHLVCVPATMPRRYTVQRHGGPQPHQPEAALLPFPPMLDMSTRPEGDFQRVVVDALTAIWARVSRCRCSSRRSVRASSPLAAGPSRQRRDTTDED